MPRWTLDDIPWSEFDPREVTPTLLEIAKTASLVEANSADYVTYLCNVFADDPEFQEAARIWGEEEIQHGLALGRWAEMADPEFSFEESLAHFRAGYSLPLDATQSVRGSQAGELIARCVVETGTSSFYSAIRDACGEPVLREIAKRIARDEFFHYQLFQKHLRRYEAHGRLPFWRRLSIALGRVQETEDDELAYAYYSANEALQPDPPAYDMKRCAAAYGRQAMSVYGREHVDNAARMILRAADINPNGMLAGMLSGLGWRFISWKQARAA